MGVQAQFLEEEQAGSAELEAQIELCERELAAQREALGSEQGRLKDLQASVEVAKVSLTRISNDLVGQQVQNAALKEQVEAKRCGGSSHHRQWPTGRGMPAPHWLRCLSSLARSAPHAYACCTRRPCF